MVGKSQMFEDKEFYGIPKVTFTKQSRIWANILGLRKLDFRLRHKPSRDESLIGTIQLYYG